jgi:hypothetical protein
MGAKPVPFMMMHTPSQVLVIPEEAAVFSGDTYVSKIADCISENGRMFIQ